MTENSDFVARYLRSDDDDRPEHLSAPPVGDEPADDQSVKAVEPETLKPAEHQPRGGSWWPAFQAVGARQV